jgi:hypothetical protein
MSAASALLLLLLLLLFLISFGRRSGTGPDEKRCRSPRTLILTFSLREKELALPNETRLTEARGLASLSITERVGVRVNGSRTERAPKIRSKFMFPRGRNSLFQTKPG